MSIAEISPVGLPQSLKYDNLPSCPESLNSYMISVAPSGITQVSGATLNTVVFDADDPGLVNQNFNSQNLDFQIPCGNSDALFLDTRETTLSGRMTIVVSTAGTGATNGRFNLIGSFASFFDALTLFSSNVPIEQVYNYGILFNQMLNSTVNSSERYGSMTISSGADENSFGGIDIPYTNTGTYYFNFSIPLISILGLNTSGTSNKLLPIGSIANLMLRMTTSASLPFATYCTAITQQPVFTTTLDQFNLNLRYVNIGDMASSLLKQTLYDGKFYIKSTCYTGSNASIPSGSFGAVSLPLQIRQSSVKSLFYQFGINKSTKCPNGYFDAINPNIISSQVNIGGSRFPSRPLNLAQRPAEAFQSYLQSWGSVSLKGIGGLMYRGSYSPLLNQVAGADNSCVVPANAVRAVSASDTTTQVIVAFPHMSYHGFDLERCGGTIFSGINTRMAAPFLELQIATALTDSVTCFAFAMSDCIIKIDPATKTCEVLV